MGDIIHSLPAVAALRASYPYAVIGWAVEERWSPLLSTIAARPGPRGPQKPLVDNIHIVDTRGWRDDPFSGGTWKNIRQSMHRLRKIGYDVSIDIQGAIKSAVLGRFAKPRRKFGFAEPWESMATMFYDHKVQATGTHIVDRNLSLAMAAGAQTPAVEPFPFPIDPVSEKWADAELQKRGLNRFAILNPGAGWGSKCWPAESFGELARRLASSGIASLVNFGPGETSLADAVTKASQGAAQPISCSLSELIALMRRSTLFVGGDTGPLHLAVALNTPSVALFGPTDPARNGPYGGRAVVVRSPQSVTTYKRSSEFEGGLASITVDEVIGAASTLLGGNLG
jgi:lipopolysaccharide heptosyltransferase I